MPQVLNLVHPKPKSDTQGAAFQYIIDSAYGNEPKVDGLPMVAANLKLRGLERDKVLRLTTDQLREAGITWEQLGGMLNGPWTAHMWEQIIPTMGYMALLRNLRNFGDAGIGKDTVKFIREKLADPDQVARSRQLPFRFLSAYKALNNDTYSTALSDALDASTQNIPVFEGRTLVLVDKSGSMDSFLSNRNAKRNRYGYYEQNQLAPKLWEVGALFALALALKQGKGSVDLAIFGDSSKRIELPKATGVLSGMRLLQSNQGVGHGTNIWGSVRQQYNGHDRVVIFTDVQDNHRNQGADLKSIPFIHTFDIGGYGSAPPLSIGTTGRYSYGGFSDATFKLMALLEHSDGSWPF
jgi:hypothetical protein